MVGQVKKTRGNASDALGAGLLILVALVYYGYDHMAEWLHPAADQARAAKALAYILKGIEGAALWLALLAVAGFRSWVFVAACSIGAVQSAQVAVCRLAFPIGSAPPAVPAFGGLCSSASGLPLMTVGAVAVLVCACVVWEKINEDRG